MDLVQRYVQSVRSLLPKSQQDDIAAELEDAIRGRIEDREQELGRKLKEPEVEAILHEFGHPIAAAGRYAPQRHLIGPEIYPYWWIGAKIAVLIAAAIAVIHGLATIASAPTGVSPGTFGRVWTDFWSIGFFLIGMFTVICAVLEHYKIKPFAEWRARDLKPFNLGAAWPDMSDTSWMSSASWNNDWNARRGRRRLITRTGAAAATFFSLIGVGLWGLLPLYIDFLPVWLDPRWWLNLWGFTLSVKWQLIFWSLLLAQSIAQALVHIAQFASPANRRLHALPDIVANVLIAIIAVLSLRETGLLYVPLPSGDELHGLRGLDLVERCVQFGLILMAVISAIHVLVSVWRLIMPGTNRAAA